MGCWIKVGSSRSMQHVWKEGWCETQSTVQHVATGCMDDVRGSLARVAHGFVCKVCRGEG